MLVTANVVPRSLNLSALMMEAILSSKTLVLSRATRPHISEDGILHFVYSVEEALQSAVLMAQVACSQTIAVM
jgi:hypothetical protein